MSERKTLKQCPSCPWKVGARPEEEIPGYRREWHERLDGTIAEPGSCHNLHGTQRLMACHYSKDGEEFPCAGWMYQQLGPGNNIWLRIEVARGRMPVPQVEGPQHETFEDTLP